MDLRQQSTANYPIPFLLILASDHDSPATGKTPTVTISKNGAAFAAAAGAVTEISAGWYSLAGNATDRNTLGALIIHVTEASSDNADYLYHIVPWNPFDQNLGLVALPTTATPGAAGGLPTVDSSGAVKIQSGTGANQLNLSGGNVTLATDPFTAIPSSYLSTQLGGMIGLINTAAGKLTFDGSNNIKSNVNVYGSGLSPEALVWGATASTYTTTGTMGKLQNNLSNLDATITSRMASGNVTVGGYASGQGPDALVWGAATSTYTTTGTFGAKVGGIAASGDPWATSLPGSYGAGTAGALLNAINTAAGKLTFDGSNNIKANVNIYGSGLSPDALVWGATATTYNVAGTMGAKLNAAGSAADPWSVVLPGAYGTGTAGNALGNLIANALAAALPTTPVAGSWGEALKFADTRLDATITSRLASGNVTVGGYATGQDPGALVWDAATSGHTTAGSFGLALGTATDPWTRDVRTGYLSTQAGFFLNAINTATNKLSFDGSNYIYANVHAYFAGQGPDALVWGAANTFNSPGTMGYLQNNANVASYATGKAPDYLTWNATGTTYNTVGTMGAKLNTAGSGADPWATTLPTGYGIGTAGYMLSAVNTAAGKLTFDADSSVQSHVYSYEGGMSPEYLTWGATAATYNATGTMGGLLNAAAPGAGGSADPWAASLSGYTAGQAGYVVNQIGNQTTKMGFDPSNNLLVAVNAYMTGQAPDALVWGASKATYNTAGTMGDMQSNSNVSTYATGKDPAAQVWNALVANYNTLNTFGNRVGAIAPSDPWATDVRTGYLSTQAGGMLNTTAGRVDATISGVPAALMATTVEGSYTLLHTLRVMAAGSGGQVERVGSTNQFILRPIGDPTGRAILTGTMDPQYLTRYGLILNP